MLLPLFMTTIQPASGDIEVMYESKERIYDLCKVESITPILKGLADVTVQKKINQTIAKKIEHDFNHYLKEFENNPFCEEGVGHEIVIEATFSLLRQDLVSISVHTISDGGVHPWYELKPYNFDPYSGTIYSLSELIPDETMTWLKRKIKQQVEEQKHQKVDDLSTIDKLYFEELIETFYITRDEIIFDFNTVLFGHAAGPTDAKIKLRELAQKLPNDNLLFKIAVEEPDSNRRIERIPPKDDGTAHP
jgi:hypothetical protein